MNIKKNVFDYAVKMAKNANVEGKHIVILFLGVCLFALADRAMKNRYSLSGGVTIDGEKYEFKIDPPAQDAPDEQKAIESLEDAMSTDSSKSMIK